jgi:hypothetical protein
MGVVMGVMVVLMVAAFIGFGRHHPMMEGHGSEAPKEEAVISEKATEAPCTDCSVETGPEKAEDNLKPEEIRDGQSHD